MNTNKRAQQGSVAVIIIMIFVLLGIGGYAAIDHTRKDAGVTNVSSTVVDSSSTNSSSDPVKIVPKTTPLAQENLREKPKSTPAPQKKSFPPGVFDERVACDRIVDPIKQDLCYRSLAINSWDASYCVLVKNNEVYSHRDTCYSSVANLNRDFALCEKIEKPENKAGCYFSLGGNNFPNGLRTTVSDCEQTTQQPDRSECFFGVAELTRDISVCNRVPDVSWDACVGRVAFASKNSGLCSLESKKYVISRASCYSQVAVAAHDRQLCESNAESYAKNNCLLGIAQFTKDSSLCAKATNEPGTFYPRDACYGSVAQRLGDVALCSKIETDERKRECYKAVAYARQDPLICKSITNDPYKSGCYIDIAEAQRDPGVCTYIIDVLTRDSACYLPLARTLKDPNLCTQIVTQKFKDQCYGEQASALKDETLCEKIQGSEEQMQCFIGIAAVTKNPALCAKVKEEKYRNWCLQITSK